MASLTAEAKRKLAELQDQILEANKELSPLRSEKTELTSGNEKLRSDNVNLQLDKDKLQEQVDAKRREYAVIETQAAETESNTTAAERRAESAEKRATEAKKEEERVISQTAKLKHAETEAQGELAGTKRLLGEKTLEYKVLFGEYIEIQQKISGLRILVEKLEGVYSRFTGAIDRALEQFHIFENRISHLSRQTGYLISYDDPKEILKDRP